MKLKFDSNMQTVVTVIFIRSKRFQTKQSLHKYAAGNRAPKIRIQLKEHAHYWLANKNCKVMQS
jgi:hypothetical protein